MARRNGPGAPRPLYPPLPTVDDVFFLGPQPGYDSDSDGDHGSLTPSLVSSTSPSPPSTPESLVRVLGPAAEITPAAARNWRERTICQHGPEASADDVVIIKDWDDMSIEEKAKCISCDSDLANSIEQLHLASKDSSAIWSCSVPSCKQAYCLECTVGYTNITLAECRVPACRRCKHPWDISLLRQRAQILYHEPDPIVPPLIYNITTPEQQAMLVAAIAKFRQTAPGGGRAAGDSAVFIDWLLNTYRATGRSTDLDEEDRKAIMRAWDASLDQPESGSPASSLAPPTPDRGGNALAAAALQGQAIDPHARSLDGQQPAANLLRMSSQPAFSRPALRGEAHAAAREGRPIIRHAQSRHFDALPGTPSSQRAAHGRSANQTPSEAGLSPRRDLRTAPQTPSRRAPRDIPGSGRSGISQRSGHRSVMTPGRHVERLASLRYNPWTPCKPRVSRIALDINQEIDYPGTLSHLMELNPADVHKGIREQVPDNNPPTLYSQLRVKMDDYEIVSEFCHLRLHEAMKKALEDGQKAAIKAEAKAAERLTKKAALRKWQGEHPTQAKVRHVLSLYDLRKVVAPRFVAWMDGPQAEEKADEKKPTVENEKVKAGVKVKAPTASSGGVVAESAAGNSAKSVTGTDLAGDAPGTQENGAGTNAAKGAGLKSHVSHVSLASRETGTSSSAHPSTGGGANSTSALGSAPASSASSFSDHRVEAAADSNAVANASEKNDKGASLLVPRAVVRKRSSFFGRLKIWGAN
ncbi:hypothetical protein IAT38_000715 [Cryptococcus sp. DSM 104549]